MVPNDKKFQENLSTDKRKKEWCCALDKNSNIIWGKIMHKIEINKGKYIVQHYIAQRNIHKEGANISPCQGCQLNTHTDIEGNSSGMRIMEIRIDELTCPIYLNQKKEGHSNKNRFIPCDLAVLERKLKEGLQEAKSSTCHLSRETFVAVEIEDFEIEYISKHISSEDHKKDVIEAYKNNIKRLNGNKHYPTIELYTDSSLRGRGSQ